MDKTPSEVTDKIRHAIKKKLMEHNLFVDEELPDYIMILIANKRSKHHMEKDLSLFLGSNTVVFTNWLWDLVNNLKAGFTAKNTKGTDAIQETKETKIDEDDVLNYDPAEEGETLCLEEVNEPTNIHISNTSMLEVSKSSLTTALPPTTIPMPNPLNASEAVLSVKPSAPVAKELPKIAPTSKSHSAVKSAKVYPVQQLKQHTENDDNGGVLKPHHHSSNTYDPARPDYSGNVNSVVCVNQRRLNRPSALQVNKLLLKAADEAAKSVLNGQNVEDYYKPTPIKELSISKLENCEIVDFPTETIAEGGNYQQHSPVFNIDMNEVSSSSSEVSVKLETIEELGSPLRREVHRYSPTEDNVITPHFIVTLDGVSMPSLKRKRSTEEPMEIDEDYDSNEECEESFKKIKLNERCKFWPNCKNSSSCFYHHPTIPCKVFPDCKFGDKCLYVHPNCKFDSLCSKKDCPFTHCSKRSFHSTAHFPVSRPVKIQSSKIVCKYYPRCTSSSCRYIHPKLCRFGTQCRDPTCRFSHFQVPQRDQLKWKASS